MALRYACHRGHLDVGIAKCISFSGVPLDQAVSEEIRRVLEPAALQASRDAWEQLQGEGDTRIESARLELTEARYEVRRAFRQYNAVDPDNRLVASELEARWNAAMEHATQIERQVEALQQESNSRPKVFWEDMERLGKQLADVWEAPQCDPRLKKRIIRTLIEEIVMDTDPAEGWLDATIHWKGGIHTERRIRCRKRGDHPFHATPKIRDAVVALAHILSDEAIAGVLNRNDIRTGHGNRWTRSHVCSFRCKRSIPTYNEEVRKREGWMTLTQAADELQVSARPLRKAIECSELPALHPLPIGPWILKRSDIDTENARAIARRIKQRRKGGILQSPDQLSLVDSNTVDSSTCPEEAV